MEDTKTQDAVLSNLEIIGEAAKHIPDEFRMLTPDISWKSNLLGYAYKFE
jgi:uncharacterized protein with HEPN domain